MPRPGHAGRLRQCRSTVGGHGGRRSTTTPVPGAPVGVRAPVPVPPSPRTSFPSHADDGSRPAPSAGPWATRVDFHSWRRTFITKAEQAANQPHLIEALVGHKRAGMTLGLYSGGPLIEQLRTVVESVKLKPLTAEGSPGEV